MLTSTGDSFENWDKEFLNPVKLPSLQDTVPEISDGLRPISVSEVTLVVRNFSVTRLQWWIAIWLEMLKVLLYSVAWTKWCDSVIRESYFSASQEKSVPWF